MRRAVVLVAVVVVVQLVLGWAASEAPWLLWVLLAVAILALSFGLWRVVRADRPVRAAAALVASGALGWGVALAVDAAIGSDSDSVASSPIAVDGLNLAASELEFVETIGTAPAPLVVPDAADPATDPETDPGPPEPSTSAAPATIDRVSVIEQGSNAVVEVTPVDPAILPAELMVVSHDRPGRPVRFAGAEGWIPEGVDPSSASITWDGAVLRVTIADGSSDGFAVVEPGGHRHPDSGYLDADGSLREVTEQVAIVEGGLLGLDPTQRSFVASLLGRQLTAGEFRLADEAGGAEIVFTAERPRFSQTDGPATSGIYAGPDGRFRCDVASCRSADDLVLPVDAAAAIVATPTTLLIDPLVPIEGASACVSVLDGPTGVSPGVTCWDDAGRPLVIERPTGERLILISATATPDPSRLTLPQEPGS